MNPKDQNTWNVLGDILWKKKDYVGAKMTFEAAIEQVKFFMTTYIIIIDYLSKCGKNKVSLRSLSMVMRCLEESTVNLTKKAAHINFLAKGRAENVRESVDFAKQAVSLDLKDGDSWCIKFN